MNAASSLSSYFVAASALLLRASRIAVASLAAGSLGYIAMLPDRYEATSKIAAAGESGAPPKTSDTLSERVLTLAASRLSADQIAELRQSSSDSVHITALLARSVRIQPTDHGNTISVHAVARSPGVAFGIANALTDAYLDSGGAGVALADMDEVQPPPPLPQAAPVKIGIDALQAELASAIDARVTQEGQTELARTLLEQENFYALARNFDLEGLMASRAGQLAALQVDRGEQSATLLPNHPKMRNFEERILALSTQLRSEGQQVVEAAEVALAAALQTETSLRARIKELASSSGFVAEDDKLHTGAVTPFPKSLEPATVVPVTKLMAPAQSAGLTAGLALLVQTALLLLLRPRQKYGTMEAEFADAVVEKGANCAPALETALTANKVIPAQRSADEPITPAPQAFIHTGPFAQAFMERNPPEAPPKVLPGPPSQDVQPRIVVVSASTGHQQARYMADDLLVTLQKRGKRVAVVDAGSRIPTAAAGISDLAAGDVSFADAIQFNAKNSLAIVSWGRRATIDLDTQSVRILLKALGELYDAVIVVGGRTSDASRLVMLLAMPGVIHTTADPLPHRAAA